MATELEIDLISALIEWIRERRRTLRVAVSYLVVIMVMSLTFSVVFYDVSYRQLGRHIMIDNMLRNGLFDSSGTPMDASGEINSFFRQNTDQSRGELFWVLVLVNLATLILGAILSYYLARRTLEPIELAFEKQSRFVSDASHELRTPITALKIANEVALRNKDLTLDEARQVISQNIEDAEGLKYLTDSLLKVLKQENQTVDLMAVSVQGAVSEAMEKIVPQAIKKNIEFVDKTKNLEVIADKEILVQVLTILFDNAIKYSPEGSSVKIETSRRAKNLIIKVIDQGYGIDGRDVDHIFDRFFRSETSRTSSGFGLGLSIAKEAMQKIDGDIAVKSRINVGSTFSIQLPLAKKDSLKVNSD